MTNMNIDDQNSDVVSPDGVIEETSAKFNCPSCGDIHRDDVVFLCNTCKQKDMVYTDGMYLCPSCSVPGQNFQCMKCDSKEVTMFTSNQ